MFLSTDSSLRERAKQRWRLAILASNAFHRLAIISKTSTSAKGRRDHRLIKLVIASDLVAGFKKGIINQMTSVKKTVS